jgi:hypothetical protein
MTMQIFQAVPALSVILILLGMCQSTAQGQSTTEFFPGSVKFKPLLAHPAEPRVGLQKEVNTSRMRIAVGNSIGVLAYTSGPATLSVGVDFFIFAQTHDFGNTRLAIDVVDGYFGGHVALHDDSPWSFRLRILHSGSHFVDGHFDEASGQWVGGRGPIKFFRDFGELVARYEWLLSDFAAAAYTGLSYAVAKKPVGLKPVGTFHGIELHRSAAPRFYLAYNISFMGIPTYFGSNNAELGWRSHDWNGGGFRVYVYYNTGLDDFGQYYDRRRQHWGIGFCVDFL